MTDDQIRQLNAYNRQFYSEHGVSFARQREYFWPSWFEFVRLSSQTKSTKNTQILDIGCGSARFALFWQEYVSSSFAYTGIDISVEMLALAESDLSAHEIVHHLDERDIVEELLHNTFAIQGHPEIITVFGVLHHIPSAELRRQFLQSLLDALPNSGEIWLTLWNPARLGLRTPSTVQELDTSGDELVGWKKIPGAQRYVHWISAEEEEALLNGLHSVAGVQRWNQDTIGERGNICLLLKKTS